MAKAGGGLLLFDVVCFWAGLSHCTHYRTLMLPRDAAHSVIIAYKIMIVPLTFFGVASKSGAWYVHMAFSQAPLYTEMRILITFS